MCKKHEKKTKERKCVKDKLRIWEEEKSGGLVGTDKSVVELVEWCRLDKKNLNTLGLTNM